MTAIAADLVPDVGESRADAPAAASADAGLRLTLDIADVLSIGDDSHTLYVFGGRGDSLDAGGGWSPAGQETLDGAVFNVYLQGAAILKVEAEIDQSLIGTA